MINHQNMTLSTILSDTVDSLATKLGLKIHHQKPECPVKKNGLLHLGSRYTDSSTLTYTITRHTLGWYFAMQGDKPCFGVFCVYETNTQRNSYFT